MSSSVSCIGSYIHFTQIASSLILRDSQKMSHDDEAHISVKVNSVSYRFTARQTGPGCVRQVCTGLLR